MISHSASQCKCQMITTVNTDRCQTLKLRTSYNCSHSSNKNPAVG